MKTQIAINKNPTNTDHLMMNVDELPRSPDLEFDFDIAMVVSSVLLN